MSEELKDTEVVEAPKKGPGRPKLVTNDDGTVTVKKDALDALLARVDRLESAASKAALGKYDDKHKEKTIPEYKLRAFEGLVVTKWDDLVTDVVEKNGNGAWREEQTIRIYTEDGTDRVMPYMVFVRRYNYVPCELVSETKTGDKRILKLRTNWGGKEREYEVDSKFVN